MVPGGPNRFRRRFRPCRRLRDSPASKAAGSPPTSTYGERRSDWVSTPTPRRSATRCRICASATGIACRSTIPEDAASSPTVRRSAASGPLITTGANSSVSELVGERSACRPASMGRTPANRPSTSVSRAWMSREPRYADIHAAPIRAYERRGGGGHREAVPLLFELLIDPVQLLHRSAAAGLEHRHGLIPSIRAEAVETESEATSAITRIGYGSGRNGRAADHHERAV